MTGLIADVYLGLAALGLLATGGLIVWPVARRIGERGQRPNGLYWEPVETPVGRQWRPVHPPAPRPTQRERLAAWWASTAPRDPDAPVRAAMRGTATRTVPPWLQSDYIGRPPLGVA